MVNHQPNNKKHTQAVDCDVSRRVLAKRERHEAMGKQFRRLCSAVTSHGSVSVGALANAEVQVSSDAAITGPKQRVAVLEAALAALRSRKKSLAATQPLPIASSTPLNNVMAVPSVKIAVETNNIKTAATSNKSDDADDDYPVSLAGSSAPGSPALFQENDSTGQWIFPQDDDDDFNFMLDYDFVYPAGDSLLCF